VSTSLLLLAALLGGALCSAISTPLVIRLAHRLGWLAQPGGRHLHESPIPRAGGVAIFSGLLGGALCFAALEGPEALELALLAPELRGFFAPCLLVFLVGLLDDIRGLSPTARLLVEAIAATAVIGAGYVIDAVATPWGPLVLGPLALPVTLLWLVGVTNAFNLIDGVDGLLASVGAAALIGCAVLGLHQQMVGTPALALALAGGLLGFLPYNWRPAKIFPGDSGSLVVGFTVAAWSLKVSRNPNHAIALHAPLMICALPICETLLTLARRYVSGKPFFEGDQSHIHHVLLKKGLGVGRTVALLGGVSLSFSAAAFVSRIWRVGGALASFVFFVAIAGLGLRYLRYMELSLLGDRFLQALRKPRRGLPRVLAVARAGNRVREESGEVDLALDPIAIALREAVVEAGFDFVALLLTPRGDALLSPPRHLEARNSVAERFREEHAEGGLVWLFSSPKQPDPTQPEVRLRFPLPHGSGRLGVLVFQHSHDADSPLPSLLDLHRYLIGPLSVTLEQIAARKEAGQPGERPSQQPSQPPASEPSAP